MVLHLDWDCLTTYPKGVDPAMCTTSEDTGICDLSCAIANQTNCLPTPRLLTCSPSAGWDETYPILASTGDCTGTMDLKGSQNL